MNLPQAFQILISPEFEGDYSDDPTDRGGKTRFGITEAVARAHGYSGSMRDLPLTVAHHIYEVDYWGPLRCSAMPVELRYALFDAGVNSGNRAAIRWLQASVGTTVDGVLGPATMQAVEQSRVQEVRVDMIARRLRAMTAMPTWSSHGRGWSRRIATLLSMHGGLPNERA